MATWNSAYAQGDCINDELYPSDAVTPDADGTVTEIATCSYEQEYSRITGIEVGLNYEFTLSSGGYITVHQGTYNGPVVAQGYSPLLSTATTTQDLFPHWNTDDQCGQYDDCVTTTVQRLACTPSAMTFTYEEDCDAQSYVIQLNITSTGDAASLDINVDAAGNVTVLEDQGVGPVTLGPFPLNVVPTVTLVHDADTNCDRVIPIDFQATCPILINCGEEPATFDHCPEPSDFRHWLFSSAGTGTMRLRFLQGTIGDSYGDSLRIYDGTDASGTLLFEHTADVETNLGPHGSAVNNDYPFYAAIDVFSTTGSLYMEVVTDDYGQCGGPFPSEDYDSWMWEVVCLDCVLPQVSHSVSDDCANGQFSILLDVASTGDGQTLELTYTINDGAEQTVTNVGVGVAELGPFALNDTVNITVVPSGSDLCNIPLGDITDTGLCPVQIECGVEVSDGTCYHNQDDLLYIYQGTGTFPLGVFFDGGLLFYNDSLLIYDGGDATAPLLFAGTDGDMTGTYVHTNNPAHLLTIRIKANDYTSCQDASEPEGLAWRVLCLDCIPATATFDAVLDCANAQYFVSVNITDLGSDTEAQIGNTLNSDTLVVTAAGQYQVGPFPAGSHVMATIVNDGNFLCNVASRTMTNPVCPVDVSCPGAPLEQTYCYTDYDTTAWSYELVGGAGSTMRLTFLRGTLERSAYDKLRIYDGANNNAPVLFEHTGTVYSPYELGPEGSAILSEDGIYLGVDVAATGNALYMEMTSDVSGSCGETFDEWEWEVYCVDCTNPVATFNIVPDCAHQEFSAEVIVTQIGGDALLSITNLLGGDTLSGLGVGVHTYGPFPLDSSSKIRVFNETYPACRTNSDTLRYTAEECVSVTCGFDNTTLCYGNSDDRWYTYRSEQNVPMTIAFLYGQMVGGDSIYFYNGANGSAPLIYGGNNGGNLAGLAMPSANAGNTITMRIKTDATGSCVDGLVTLPMEWTVACGGVGIHEADASSFVVFPNPTQGMLQIEFGTLVKGPVRVRVLDQSGRVVIDQPLHMVGSTRNTIDMRNLQSGNYMLQLITTDQVMTQRVQVVR
jgi:hypothetical protein